MGLLITPSDRYAARGHENSSQGFWFLSKLSETLLSLSRLAKIMGCRSRTLDEKWDWFYFWTPKNSLEGFVFRYCNRIRVLEDQLIMAWKDEEIYTKYIYINLHQGYCCYKCIYMCVALDGLSLMLLVVNLANRKWCKHLKNDWNPGTWVLI